MTQAAPKCKVKRENYSAFSITESRLDFWHLKCKRTDLKSKNPADCLGRCSLYFAATEVAKQPNINLISLVFLNLQFTICISRTRQGAHEKPVSHLTEQLSQARGGDQLDSGESWDPFVFTHHSAVTAVAHLPIWSIRAKCEKPKCIWIAHDNLCLLVKEIYTFP